MSPEEAHFWIVAMAETRRRDLAPAMLRDDLWARRDALRRPITIEDAVKLIRDTTARVPLSSLSFAVNLFPRATSSPRSGASGTWRRCRDSRSARWCPTGFAGTCCLI